MILYLVAVWLILSGFQQVWQPNCCRSVWCHKSWLSLISRVQLQRSSTDRWSIDIMPVFIMYILLSRGTSTFDRALQYTTSSLSSTTTLEWHSFPFAFWRLEIDLFLLFWWFYHCSILQNNWCQTSKQILSEILKW